MDNQQNYTPNEFQPETKKKKLKPWMIVVIVIFGLAVFFGVLGDASENDSDVPDSDSPSSSISTPTSSVSSDNKEEDEHTYHVGETGEYRDFSISFLSVFEHKGVEFSEPQEGKIFLICEIELENISDEDMSISLLSFDAYADDYSVDDDIFILSSLNMDSFGGTVAPGKKMKGSVAYEVPKDWTNFQLDFEPFLLSDQKIHLVVSKEDLT